MSIISICLSCISLVERSSVEIISFNLVVETKVLAEFSGPRVWMKKYQNSLLPLYET